MPANGHHLPAAWMKWAARRDVLGVRRIAGQHDTLFFLFGVDLRNGGNQRLE
jgi:hypothetical protein